ncbi:MAG: PD40 domain-containing protein [Ktedonobacteraceae bacterium]|nr:PD40 domain-containing protein [Ktedonobacteraceae bacterium]
MNCEHVREMLSAYLDNALFSEERESVAVHLQSCQACNAILADYRRFDTLLSELPRVSPDPSLHMRIFSSPEYLELTGTYSGSEQFSDPTLPHRRLRRDSADRPHLVALPGGRLSNARAETVPGPAVQATPRGGVSKKTLFIMRAVIAACLLLTLLIGGFTGWNILQQRNQATRHTTGITPPADLQQGPLPAGLRFVFLRDGALWSAPTDGSTSIARLTPDNTTVAANWIVRPARPGRSAGNMLAYIDLQQARIHTIRSDGQSDTIINMPLVKPGTSPISLWDTATGATILNSLAWSPDGTQLAFAADPQGTGLPGLYIHSTATGTVQQVPLPTPGIVSHLSWSPDGIRIAFVLNHDGKESLLDYNTQNHGMLTIASPANMPLAAGERVLTLAWSPTTNAPAVTWSTGNEAVIHSIWLQHIGTANTSIPRSLISGNFVQATYSQKGPGGTGNWLLINLQAGLPGDLISIDINATATQLTYGKQASFARWSPDGRQVIYLNAFSGGTGTLHLVNSITRSDTQIAAGVTNDPLPAWSMDSQYLAYSSSTQTQIINTRSLQATQAVRPFPPPGPQGPATTLSWSAASPSQLVVALGDGQQGIYLVDIQRSTSSRLDQKGIQGPVSWSLIP